MTEHLPQSAICSHCGTPFTFTWPHTRSKFCSQKCSKADWRDRHRDQLRAAQKEYVTKHRERRRESLHNYYQGKGKVRAKNYRAENWDRLYARIKERYLNDPTFRKALHGRAVANAKLKRSGRIRECEACGSKKDLQCHHVNLDPTDNLLTNLMWLCRWCHTRLHAQLRDEIA